MIGRSFHMDRIKIKQFRCNVPPRLLKYNVKHFATDTSLQSHDKLNQFVSHFQSFKPLADRCNLGALRDLSDYKLKKKFLKECMKNRSVDLEHCDLKTLFKLFMYCLEVSDKCNNKEFNLKLIHTIITHLQLNKAYVDDSHDFLKNGSHLIDLIESFLKFNVQDKLPDYFEFLYMSLNRDITNYSADDLVKLSTVLGDLYLSTRLDGLKILLQKSLYSLFDQIDRSKLNVSIYTWIKLIKSISKCNENYLYKKLIPYISLSIESNPLFGHINRGFNHSLGADTKDDDHGKTIQEETYKFVKLNVHLLNNLLFVGIVDNVQLIDLILQTVTKFLINYASPSNTLGSIYSVNEYNKENYFINELLYKKYSNKLFKAPQTPSDGIANATDSFVFANEKANIDTISGREDNVLHCALIKLLYHNKIAFVRGLKLAEMYLSTMYPTLYSRLSKSRLLHVARLVKFHNEKEYIRMTNLMSENVELILSQSKGHPIIVLVDIYYLISTDRNETIYFEIVDRKGGNNKLTKLSEFKLNYLKSLGWECIKVTK